MIDQLWAGWRRSFIESSDQEKKRTGCVLCSLGAESDSADSEFVLLRAQYNYVVLNAYPYSPGHMMVVPFGHCGDIEEIASQALAENMLLMKKSVSVLREVYNPDGFNLGANLGRAGGAAFDDHVHFHVVPRWIGDTNFMTATASMRVIPESLESTFTRLISHFG